MVYRNCRDIAINDWFCDDIFCYKLVLRRCGGRYYIVVIDGLGEHVLASFTTFAVARKFYDNLLQNPHLLAL